MDRKGKIMPRNDRNGNPKNKKKRKKKNSNTNNKPRKTDTDSDMPPPIEVETDIDMDDSEKQSVANWKQEIETRKKQKLEQEQGSAEFPKWTDYYVKNRKMPDVVKQISGKTSVLKQVCGEALAEESPAPNVIVQFYGINNMHYTSHEHNIIAKKCIKPKYLKNAHWSKLCDSNGYLKFSKLDMPMFINHLAVCNYICIINYKHIT